MLPRLRTCHVTVVALACAVVLAPARGGEPGAPQKTTRVYAVADLIVPIPESVTAQIVPPASFAATSAEPMSCDFEIMCHQPTEESCCKAGQKCCQAAAPACCPNGPCCPNGACCPDGSCCAKSGCCAKSATNWTAIAAPEWCKSEAAKVQPQDALINLITGAVCPRDWSASGGPYTIDYMATGKGLVVNAPDDVQEQVACLLESLRHLQNIQVAFDVKVVTVSDASFQQNFDALSFAGGNPVFLTDREARGMLDNFQGDPKCKVVCAPKLTVFNGQRAAISCTQEQSFVTGSTPAGANKLTPCELQTLREQPTVTGVAEVWTKPTPCYGSLGVQACMPKADVVRLGFEMVVRPTVSADHRFVRCELKADHCELASPTVPVFPVTQFITPIFEGGAQGQPIPFTQFIQQPNIARRNIESSLTIPDGGTAMLYAGRCEKADPAAAEEPSAPLVDWIYDLVDLFSPPAETPTVTEHMFVLVTPRVIIQHEEMIEAQPMPMGPCQAGTCCSAPVVKQCAAMADAPTCPSPCAGPLCPSQSVWAAVPPPPVEQRVQLDVCVLCMDPAAWDSPLTLSWADLSPKACDGKPKVMSPEEAKRFCQSMKAQQVGRMLAEPRMVVLDGHAASFHSGGQQAVPVVTGSGSIVGTRFEPFGTQLTVLPVVLDRGGFNLELDASISKLTQSNGYSIGELVVAGRNEQRVRTFANIAPGQTVLTHCGRDADGRDVMMTVTPRIVDSMTAPSAMPMPAPTFRGQMGVEKVEDPPIPIPLGHPCCTGTPSCMTNSLPACSTCPAPMPPPLVQVATTEPQDEPLLAKFMAKYRQACAVGDKAKAQAYADCCLAIDPTCFQK